MTKFLPFLRMPANGAFIETVSVFKMAVFGLRCAIGGGGD